MAAGLVKQIVSELLDISVVDLTEDSGLERTPGWDSLMHCMILTELENRTGVSFDLDDMRTAQTIDEITTLLSQSA